MNEMNLALQLMMYGLIGVFTALILFYAAIKLLVLVFPHKEGQEQ